MPPRYSRMFKLAEGSEPFVMDGELTADVIERLERVGHAILVGVKDDGTELRVVVCRCGWASASSTKTKEELRPVYTAHLQDHAHKLMEGRNAQSERIDN